MAYEVFKKRDLLNIPNKRAAWSDRTAHLMAQMSKLAYCKFEMSGPLELDQAQLNLVVKLLKSGTATTSTELSPGPDGTPEGPTVPADAIALSDELKKAGFVIVGLFNSGSKGTDTQAFLTQSAEPNGVAPFHGESVVILSFRGTETIKDWMTNVKLIQGQVRGVNVHQGFQEAFESVESDITIALDSLLPQGATLYLTGHSLGGALALIATREIAPESHGACYSFGAPRVARFGFARKIKTPIYRVVNRNDLVPRVPPAYIQTVIRFGLSLLNIPWLKPLDFLIKRLEKYVHHGDLRFIRKSGPEVMLLSNPSVIYRFFWYWPALIKNWRSPSGDHSIDVYCQKLEDWATKRVSP